MTSLLLCLIVVRICESIEFDQFGITKLFKSTGNGLDFDPNWNNTDRTVYAVAVDPNSTNQSCYARGGSASFAINATTNIMTMTGDSPRYYCYLNHTNVEVTVYAKRGNETKTLSTQGLVVVARSRHKDYDINYCNAQSYYFRLYNSGKACFLKEFIHSDDCLIYGSGNPCIGDFAGDGLGVIPGKWYGMKLIIQNIDDHIVNLQGFVDFDDGVDGGDWQLILEYNDTNQWRADVEIGEEECMSNCSYNETENWMGESTSVFLRASYVEQYQWKYFSIREIEPLAMYSLTESPTMYPSMEPTMGPSRDPTTVPTVEPTKGPSMEPSKEPSHSVTTSTSFNLIDLESTIMTTIGFIGNTTDPTTIPSSEQTNVPTMSTVVVVTDVLTDEALSCTISLFNCLCVLLFLFACL